MKTFLRTLFFFVIFWLHQLLILPLLLLYGYQQKRQGEPALRKRVNGITSSWGWLTCMLAGAKVERVDLSGVDEEESFLIVSNHQGDFDIPLLLGWLQRPIAFVAKKELGGIPLVSDWMRLMGCVFLDREDRRKQVKQIREVCDLLKGGLNMVIFPEGTRSRSSEMAPFAKGSLQIAQRAGLRILPVTLDRTWSLKPKGSMGFPGGKVRIVLHPPVDPKALDEETREHLHDYVQNIIRSGQSELQEETA